MSDEVYTCKGKGGSYVVLGRSTGAGLSRGEDRVFYADLQTGNIYHRAPEDFDNRMELIDLATKTPESNG